MEDTQNVKRPEGETAAEMPQVEFPTSGRVSVRGDGQPQPSYNLLVLDVAAVTALEGVKARFPELDHTDSQGQSWISVTVDAAGKAKLRQAARQGATKLVVEGVVTLVDIVNGKPQGYMRVTGARPANLLDGGRIVTRESREPREPAAPMASYGFRGRRGA